MSHPLTVLVTGATGHLGHAIALAFRRAGHDVLGLTRDPGRAHRLAAGEIAPVQGELQAPEAWAAVAARADVIVHAAIDYHAGGLALDREATLAMLDVAARSGATFLYTSGAWVHGDTHGQVVDERSPLAPTPLVAERPATERLVRDARGVHGVVLRPGVVYGGRGGLTAGWFRGEGVVGDGTNRWAMVHVDDLADAYLRAALRAPAGAVYLVAEDDVPPVGVLADAARRSAGLPGTAPRLALAEARAGLGAFADALAMDQRVSARRAREDLDWRPTRRGLLADIHLYRASALAGA